MAGATCARPRRRPRTYRGALATIPIAPTEFSRDGPRAGDPVQRPERAWTGCGIGPSEGGQPPAVTPANGGYYGRPPPRNLRGDAGQRPTIYRLHRCRGHGAPGLRPRRQDRAARADEPHEFAGQRSLACRVGDSPRMLKRGRQVRTVATSAARLPVWQGRCRGRQAGRPAAAKLRCTLAFHPHIYSPTSFGPGICVQRLMCTEVAGGERFSMGKTQLAIFPIQSGPLFFGPFCCHEGLSRERRSGGPPTGEPPPTRPQSPPAWIRARRRFRARAVPCIGRGRGREARREGNRRCTGDGAEIYILVYGPVV